MSAAIPTTVAGVLTCALDNGWLRGAWRDGELTDEHGNVAYVSEDAEGIRVEFDWSGSDRTETLCVDPARPAITLVLLLGVLAAMPLPPARNRAAELARARAQVDALARHLGTGEWVIGPAYHEAVELVAELQGLLR